MKRSIKFHQESLESMKSYLERERILLDKVIAQFERQEQSVKLLEAQIDLAIKEGKDGFDDERYAIKRLCV